MLLVKVTRSPAHRAVDDIGRLIELSATCRTHV
jgi:hypothetical protein